MNKKFKVRVIFYRNEYNIDWYAVQYAYYYIIPTWKTINSFSPQMGGVYAFKPFLRKSDAINFALKLKNIQDVKTFIRLEDEKCGMFYMEQEKNRKTVYMKN